MNNTSMSITQTNTAIPPELLAQMEEAARNAMSPIRNAEIMRRACLEMDRISEGIREKHGVLAVGVQAIRELRDA
jgi:hypothetical protein